MGNKTYLVTGASKGIGRSIARTLAKNGYQVLLLARPSQELDAASDEIQAMSPSRIMRADDPFRKSQPVPRRPAARYLAQRAPVR